MVAFSPKALRLVNAAIDLHASSVDRQRWLAWKESHPGIRAREDGQQDIAEPKVFPEDVGDILTSALRRRERQLRDELDSVNDWDENRIAELDNQISYLKSVAAFIETVPRKPRRDSLLRRVMGR